MGAALCSFLIASLCPLAMFCFSTVALLYLSRLFLGSEASREGVEAGERHSGGEGERHSAEPASAGLRQHR